MSAETVWDWIESDYSSPTDGAEFALPSADALADQGFGAVIRYSPEPANRACDWYSQHFLTQAGNHVRVVTSVARSDEGPILDWIGDWGVTAVDEAAPGLTHLKVTQSDVTVSVSAATELDAVRRLVERIAPSDDGRGWDVADATELFEGTSLPLTSVEWGDNTLVTQRGYVEPGVSGDLVTVDIKGATGWATYDGIRTLVTWTPPGSSVGYGLYVYTDDLGQAVGLAASIETTDLASWIDRVGRAGQTIRGNDRSCPDQ